MGVDFTLIHADHYLLTPEAQHLEFKVNVRGYSHILAIRVCAAGKGTVFKPFGLV